MKVRIPYIIENGISGLMITSFIGGLFNPNGIFPKYFIINDETIFHTGTKKTFSTKDAKSLLIEETEISPVTKDSKLDIYKPVGKEIKLFIKMKNSSREQILPTFLWSVHNWGENDWNKFLRNLSKALNLSVEG